MREHKKKICAITFHSSYNHGSVLQAYALQQFITKEFGNYFTYNIINLRTERQKKFYDRSYTFLNIRNDLKKILFSKHKTQISERKKKYEYFINNILCLTDEYSSMDGLVKADFDSDYYISGSDQIWNYTLLDFDWSFFLEFVERGKKISYAASFGPETLKLDEVVKKRLKKDLSEYSNISVREAESANKIEQVLGKNIAKVHIDPTLLLGREEWSQIIGDRIIEGDYIFLYDLKGDRNAYEISRKLSKTYNMPVVVIKENARMYLLYRDFVKKYDAGPTDFLNYIKYAKIVVSSSFHGNVFSIIFERPFLAVGGREDLRISNLLKLTGLEERAVSDANGINLDGLLSINFTAAELAIERERERSKKYLVNALDLEAKSE